MPTLRKKTVIRVLLAVLIVEAALLLPGIYTHFISRSKEALFDEDSELVKIRQVFDHFKEGDFEVVVDGNYRKPAELVAWARGYIQRQYHPGEDTARSWIENHCYRSLKGEIMYFKYSGGKTVPMRDVFLEALNQIEGKPDKT